MTTITQGQTTPTTPATNATHHAADQQAAPLDLHELCRVRSAAGYTRNLELLPYMAENIASRLRGISAISTLFAASNNEENFILDCWLRGGLIDALACLAMDASHELERANDRAAALERGAA